MKHRTVEMLSAGAMSDIAFLLLIFFVTTTQILDERGIPVVLPRLDAVSRPVTEDQIFHIHMNAANQILAAHETTNIHGLEAILNAELGSPDPLVARKVIISLHCDRGTMYETFIQVYDCIRSVYAAKWDGIAQSLYHKAYSVLSPQEKQRVQTVLPLVISEAEWTQSAD